MAETSSLLRNRTFTRTEGSNPSLSATGFFMKNVYARVAQLDRVPGYEPGGRRFESFHAHHIPKILKIIANLLVILLYSSLRV